jgi:ApeA N-terminal domain 1
MSILEERGLFWWHETPIPDQHFAPDSAKAGVLTIESDGHCTLELDGFLYSDKHPLAALISPEPQIGDKYIQGMLKGSGKSVLLVGLIKAGGQFRSTGISYERYRATDCLIGDRALPSENKLVFRNLEVELDGFEEWLRLGAIESMRSKYRISLTYRKPGDLLYTLASGTLSFKYHLNGPVHGKQTTDTIALKEVAVVAYRPKRSRPLGELKEIYCLLEDLIILLTDSDYCLEWPFISLSKDIKYRWYFTRIKSRGNASIPKTYECWTNFIQLRDTFGQIWSNWLRMRDDFGAGLYLYLGTRRGVKLYVEHRFVNLIWGIEALHRKRCTAVRPAALAERIERIVEQVSATKDRKWLERKLQYAHEPALEQRIYDAFAALPIRISKSRLQMFAKSCADLRNDISHFGGPRPGTTYEEFMRHCDSKSDALSILYHTLLLQEVGVEEAILKRYIYHGPRSHSITRTFVEVGLFDPAKSS